MEIKNNLNIKFYISENKHFSLNLSKEELETDIIYRNLGDKLKRYDWRFHNTIIRSFFTDPQSIQVDKNFMNTTRVSSFMINDYDVPITLIKDWLIKFEWM